MNIYELLLEKNENIYLYAESGAGKTTQLVFAYKKFLENANGKIIPIYIPLREYDGSESFVKEYIISNYFVDVTVNRESLKPLFADFGGKIILLFDGLNEMSYGRGICKEIQEISVWKNVQVLITSRYDDKDYFKNFQRFSLLEIDNDYLKEKISDYAILNRQLKKLLSCPFYYTMYNRITDSSKRELQRAGQLMELFYKNMINRITLPEHRDYSNIIVFGFVPFLCFKMSLTADLKINEETVDAIFNKWYILLKDRQKIKIKKEGVIRYDYIETILGNSVCRERHKKLYFHESSRDFFAAFYEKDKVQIIDGKEWAEAANGNILSLVASLNGRDYDTIIVPEGMVAIHDWAFNDGKFREIILSDGIKSIGEGAFVCSNLESINIPDSVISIGSVAFFCSNLENINIPDSVTSIGKGAFVCSNLKNINIPNSVTSIGENTFLSCSNLESISIPDSVTSIGKGAFFRCRNLESIKIPDSVTSIGEFVFLECNSLKSINIPNGVTCIGSDAFFRCCNLTIKCHDGSYAHQYAKENGINFVLI